ncbi:3beta-hydroxysteroid-4alpha-carboxylate 3-dehydrogenas(decarboxylating) [Malassezia cuniculi]|uniref:3beta-hydroxysteroid-4alpha-carboxylate 3-dehydrogenas(Decarboxylating) n=1 Tax=Malassezia cuniculi TaxID=948313 RepID=A0AAF0J9P5_9BASI|nr:3beta-hydroxysteroid-4alpha-carboxylate 3-dehydrogenas(decarboxylating) [Malassezia cuniculi]
MSTSSPTQELHFVIGGAGFLGSYIARALVARGEKAVASFDLRQAPEPVDGVHYYTGDLTKAESLAGAISAARADTKSTKPVVIYHTASPVAGLGPEVYEAVNVRGTRTVIKVAQDTANKVAKLVFTSSAGVVFSGKDLNYVDERMQYPTTPLDSYNDTKARAEEAVLEANDPDGLQTVALRPAGIFGPGDRQALPGFFGVLESGRTKWQIGDNQNLFDWTYVENVAHAHLLAADRLGTPSIDGAPAIPPVQYEAKRLLSEHIDVRSQSEAEKAAERDVPISPRRPDVPAPATDYARSVGQNAWSALKESDGLDQRPVFRNRFDPLFHHAFPDVPSGGNPAPKSKSLAKEHLGVAGEAFFITNGQPITFWDFPRALWFRYNGHVVPQEKLVVIGLRLALIIAFLAECFSWISGRPVQFTRYRVTYTACARYYNIEKARRLLGYEPLVGMDEAIERSAAWWRTVHPPEHAGESRKDK